MTHFKRPVAAAVSALLAGVCFSSVALAAPGIERSHAPRASQSLDAASGKVHVFVRLDEESVASFNLREMARTGTMPDGAAQRAQAARVDAAKAGIRAALSGLGADEFMDLRVGDAGVGVTVDARYLPALRSLPGVKQVAKVEMVKPNNANSVPWIGAPGVHLIEFAYGQGTVPSGFDELVFRQQIKRKAANWGKRYQALARAERVAVLAAMMAVEAEEA